MLTYYFYNNVYKHLYKTYKTQAILSIVFELDFFINNAFYLNKFFLKNVSTRRLSNKKTLFDYNFFFLKIKFFNKILWKYLGMTGRSKVFKTLLFFFYTAVSSVISKSLFLKFNFCISLVYCNTINYFEVNKFLLIKTSRNATSFLMFYFLMFLYKPYLVVKLSLFSISFYKNISFEIFNLFSFIELKSKTKSNYSRWILI